MDLRSRGLRVVGYFYNPNIQPEEEYLKRLKVAIDSAHQLKYELVIGEYGFKNWSGQVKGLEDEPEGGKRCEVCFDLRLKDSFNKARELKLDYFTSTLSVSPHKNAALINKIGKSISPEIYLESDFKKNDGFRKTMDFARKVNFYRQNYCGCLFGRRN